MDLKFCGKEKKNFPNVNFYFFNGSYMLKSGLTDRFRNPVSKSFFC